MMLAQLLSAFTFHVRGVPESKQEGVATYGGPKKLVVARTFKLPKDAKVVADADVGMAAVEARIDGKTVLVIENCATEL